MSVGQVVAIVALLAHVYQVDPALMDCVVYRESSYNVASQNGIHEGLAQYNPDTRAWMLEIAAMDALWMHGGIPAGPVQDVALTAWALKNGMGGHWATFKGCGGEG